MSVLPPPPVEFAVAVERYLAATPLTDGSRRVYRIALTAWAWTLIDEPAPTGPARRGARPPVVPLAALDDPAVAARVRAALDGRSPRTRARELSTLRSAVRWWRAQGWLDGDPLAAATSAATPHRATGTAPLTETQLRSVLGLRAGLREQAFWHLLHDTGASAVELLALDIADLDRTRLRTHVRAAGRGLPRLYWSHTTARLLTLLLQGRTSGPAFVTDRRAPATTPPADRCPLTGRGRLSYRRAAELFTATTRPLDPSGHGWTLHALRVSPPFDH